MRAVLTLPTPGKTLTLDDLVDALRPTTWLPAQAATRPVEESEDLAAPTETMWLRERTKLHLDTLPGPIRAQVSEAPHVFIQIGSSVEGIVSTEREQVVLVRLFETAESIEAIKQGVTVVASRLPEVFRIGSLPDLKLDDEVVIRQSNDGRTLAKGKIVTPHTLRFRPYLKTERPRERRLLIWLAWLGSVALASGVALAWTGATATALIEVKGYSDRLASALAVAIMTTLINLVFEYRDWRNERTEVAWLFG